MQFALIAAFVGVINIVLLYRPIGSLGRLTVLLWSGTLLTTAAVIFTGARHFDVRIAFDFPPGAFNFSLGFLIGLGGASRVAIYDYLGYYDICYIGDEVKDPVRVIPRSILLSIVLVAMIYLAINLSVIGVVPWREFVPAADHPSSKFIVSVFMEKVYGPTVASFFTAAILWTGFGSVFALLLGYSRIPYAAAKDGNFFSDLRPAPSHASRSRTSRCWSSAPFRSCAASFRWDRSSMRSSRRGFWCSSWRRSARWRSFAGTACDRPLSYRMWLYPLPSLLALAGWIFVFATSDVRVILFGLGTLLLGVLVFHDLVLAHPAVAVHPALERVTPGTLSIPSR